MVGESSRRHPRISHVSNSTIGSDFGSSPDYTSYIVHVPLTPDNNPAPLQIALGDIDSVSSYKDDESDLTDLRITDEEEEEDKTKKEEEEDDKTKDEEEEALLYKISDPLTRIVKISPIIIALYRSLSLSLNVIKT